MRIWNWWENHSVGETATLAFWNLALVAFIGGAAWTAKVVMENNQSPDCAETYRVTDPRLNAVLFLQDLEDLGLFDPDRDAIEDFAWVYESGQLRFMVALNSGRYTATACYADGKALFHDLQFQNPQALDPRAQ
ncbi:MAG: hypothetical protein E2O74_06450 [Chloroflexi bacterium]|nr:MAG: hypothetical protein E2O74_06450 [Chloroflexota bacterium]